MTATGQQLLLRSIDDYLGPGETRFFSHGYQRSVFDVHDLVVHGSPGGGPCVTGAVDVSYPADWSRKKAGVDLRPHLSTIDAFVLGVQLAEVHLVHARGLSPEQLSALRLRKVVLRAGGAPQEELKDVRLSAVLADSESRPAGADPARAVTVYNCTVGGLRARVEIEIPAGAAADAGPAGDVPTSFTEALGDARTRFYGAGFTQRRHTIENVEVDLESFSAQARARFTTVPGAPLPADGIDGADQPAVSLIEGFVVNLQLAQVLMYELDSLTRESTNTLWMMQTVLEAPEVPQPLTEPGLPLPVRTAITARRLLPLRGASWRSVELSGALAGISMRASFAHELPARDVPTEDATRSVPDARS